MSGPLSDCIIPKRKNKVNTFLKKILSYFQGRENRMDKGVEVMRYTARGLQRQKNFVKMMEFIDALIQTIDETTIELWR